MNFLVTAAATSNYSPNLYELFRTNGYQKGHDQHHIMGSKSLTHRQVIHICWLSGGPGERDIAVKKGITFQVRHGLFIEKGHGLLVQAWSLYTTQSSMAISLFTL